VGAHERKQSGREKKYVNRKKSRQRLGADNIVVMLGLGFTGYLLPWDMKALFATKVGLQIAEATPLWAPMSANKAAGRKNT
jgi:hypothetical protein